MAATRHTTHIVDPVYSTPVLRMPSPSDSINTEYGQDETSMMDTEPDDDEFARRVEEQIGLRRTTWAEAGIFKSPILQRPPKDSKEEQQLFERVMKNLREKVKEVEEEELFDIVVQQNPGPAFFAPQPSSRDVDAIMRSMLPSSKPPQNSYNYPASYAPSYPSSFPGRFSSTNGEGTTTIAAGSRYGNLGRNQ